MEIQQIWRNFKYRRYLAYEKYPVKRRIWQTFSVVAKKLLINLENDRMESHDGCRILWPERGVPNNCKTVFVFDNHEDKKFFQTFLGTIGLHILEDILFQKGIMAWKMRER